MRTVSPPLPASQQGRLWTWLVAGTGVAAAGAGGVLAYLAHRDTGSADNEPWADEAQRLSDRAGSRAKTSQILLGTAGVALIAAFVLYQVEGAAP